jgi:predicted RNA binding protein YcfA (HicA-like mRNA interferase family)
MASFPPVNSRQAIRALKKLGFRLERIEGSQHMTVKDGYPHTIPIPVLGSKSLPAGTLRSIIRMAAVTKDAFFKSLK